MDTRLIVLLDVAEKEFDGQSFNGPSLMATLDQLSAAEAASRATYEGYSAWEIAIHCAYYKHFIAKGLVGAAALEHYPYEETNFAPIPESADESAWKSTRAVLRRCHHAVMKILKEIDGAALDAIFAEWELPFIDAVGWLATHDSYHNAQIRSMGLPSLLSPKER